MDAPPPPQKKMLNFWLPTENGPSPKSVKSRDSGSELLFADMGGASVFFEPRFPICLLVVKGSQKEATRVAILGGTPQKKSPGHAYMTYLKGLWSPNFGLMR